MADKVMEVATPTVAAVSVESSAASDSSEIKHLREEVARLASLVESLTRCHHILKAQFSARLPPDSRRAS